VGGLSIVRTTPHEKEIAMSNTAGNVRVGVTGSVYYAATTQALPASLTATTTGFTDLGYIGEDGITESQSTDTNEIKAWQNGDICRRVQTSHELTYQFTLLETSAAVETLFYGDTFTAGTPGHITADEPVHKGFVLDVVDGTKKRRICIPDGQITERGEVVYAASDPQSYQVTITCYADVSGNKAYIYEGTTA
jgi:hypothetical protein